MGEFLFLDEPAKNIQKKLNQWKHSYKLKIVTSKIHYSAEIIGQVEINPYIAIMLYREPMDSSNQ